MSLQQTLRRPLHFEGLGLHSGLPIQLTLRPAPVNHGVVFRRTDLQPAVDLPAHFGGVVATELATTLGAGQVRVSTVEHILSALAGALVSNVLIEVSGPEVPVMDGSSQGFYETILNNGLTPQSAAQSVWVVRKKVELHYKEKWATIEPSDTFSIHASIDWDHPCIGYQEFRYKAGDTPYSELCGARTFGFLQDVEEMRRRGLARGGSLSNAVVLDAAKVLNPEGLRYQDEFIRHKVLDAVGDFMLAGLPIRGHFRLHRTGHDLHHQILKRLFSESDAIERCDVTSDPAPLSSYVTTSRLVSSF